jgi:hypothetical protein
LSFGVTRDQLQRLAQAKIDDAILLFDNGRWGNAYYLAGYSVEFALKACAAKLFTADALPDKALVNRLYSHKFSDLMGSAGLSAALKEQQDKDSDFAAYWGILGNWSPDARYEPADKSNAHYMLIAITDPNHGVLPWIKMFW